MVLAEVHTMSNQDLENSTYEYVQDKQVTKGVSQVTVCLPDIPPY